MSVKVTTADDGGRTRDGGGGVRVGVVGIRNMPDMGRICTKHPQASASLRKPPRAVRTFAHSPTWARAREQALAAAPPFLHAIPERTKMGRLVLEFALH